MNIHSLLHALGLDVGSHHGSRKEASVTPHARHAPVLPGLPDERIAAIEGSRRRTPVSLSPTSPSGFRRIDTDRRGVPRHLRELGKALTESSRWHGERDHTSFYSALINATCGAPATSAIVAGLKEHVYVTGESQGLSEVPEGLRAPLAPNEAVIGTVCTCLGLNVIVYVVEESSTLSYPVERIEQGPYILLIRESGLFSVVRSSDFVHEAFLTMRRHSELIKDLLSLRQECDFEATALPHQTEPSKRHIGGRVRSPTKILRL